MGHNNRSTTKRTERTESLGRTALYVLLSGVAYYLATQVAWALCFPNSKVSLFFPPHAVLVSILLLAPTRHWWAYTLAAIGGHLLATQQAHWPFLYSLHCEAFDAVQNLAAAAGLRIFIKSPLKLITLRDAIVFILIAVVIVPFGTAFWGAAFTISNHFGTYYWVEWRNLGISNAVTAIVLVPAILLGVHQLAGRPKPTWARLLEAALLGAGLLVVGVFAFDNVPAGPNTSPALLYAPIPLLIWAALRFGLGGTSASMVVITFLAIWGTMHGRGPFLMQSPAENALALQMFLLVTALPLMLLAVLIEEEKGSQSALRESEARFRNVADTAPVLIWMSDTDKLRTFFNKGWLDLPGAPWHRNSAKVGQKQCMPRTSLIAWGFTGMPSTQDNRLLWSIACAETTASIAGCSIRVPRGSISTVRFWVISARALISPNESRRSWTISCKARNWHEWDGWL